MLNSPNHTKKSVIVIGELNVDFIITSEEISPEPNREKIVDGFDMVLGSSSAITACALAGLGLNVVFVGVVGNDYFGEFCIEKLKTKGVDTTYIQKLPNCKTGITFSFSTPKDRALLTYMGTIPSMAPKNLPVNLLKMAQHIHFGSYYLQKNMQEYWKKLFSDAQKAGISTSFDTGWDPQEEWRADYIHQLLKYTNLFIPSEEEFRKIFGGIHDKRLLEKFSEKERFVIIKRGSEGSCLLSNGQMDKVPGYSVNPIDTTGAGDSFNAGVIFGYLEGKKGVGLLNFANACGAFATLGVGGAEDVPDLNQVKSFIIENTSFQANKKGSSNHDKSCTGGSGE